MAPFLDLRSDSPLYLTSSERPYSGALKQSYKVGLSSRHAIPVPRFGCRWWFISWFLVDRAFPDQHYSHTIDDRYDPAEIRIYAGYCTHSCSPLCARSASVSACGLTLVRSSDHESQLHVDEHLTPSLEHRCSNLHGNSDLNICESPASSLSPKSFGTCRCWVPFDPGSGPHSPIRAASLSGLQVRNATEGVHFVSVAPKALVRGHRSRSRQRRRNTSCLKAEEQ